MSARVTVVARDPLADYRRTGLLSRFCFSCHHAQWNHRGVYPRKRACALRGCRCVQYLELQREQAEQLLREHS